MNFNKFIEYKCLLFLKINIVYAANREVVSSLEFPLKTLNVLAFRSIVHYYFYL